MDPASTLFVGLALLILLAVTSLRYGVDSRDGFRSRRGAFAPRGIVRDDPSSSAKPVKAARSEDTRPGSASADCGLAPCPA